MDSEAELFAAIAEGVVASGAALLLALGWLTGSTKTDGGEIAVIRHPGLFDDNNIRDVIDPSSGLTHAGLWSHVHEYPVRQRFYSLGR